MGTGRKMEATCLRKCRQYQPPWSEATHALKAAANRDEMGENTGPKNIYARAYLSCFTIRGDPLIRHEWSQLTLPEAGREQDKDNGNPKHLE